MPRGPKGTWLPQDDYSEYSLVPDIVVMDVAYKYTGLRDANGNKILRRVSRPVGFTANLDQFGQYVVDHDERDEPDQIDPERDDDQGDDDYLDEGEDVEGE